MATDSEPTQPEETPVRIDIREAYEAVFMGILGRKPSPSEIAAWLDNQGAPTPVASLALALRTTDEYGDKLALQCERTARRADGRRVFFLHIPKSGGISLRTQIRASLGGVAPLLFSHTPLDHQVEPGETSWPYLTGHVGIDACPPGYDCVTIFREPRARLLSLHRFIGSRHFEDWLVSMDLNPATSRRWRQRSIETIIAEYGDVPSGRQGNPHLGARGLRFGWMFADGASTPGDFAALGPAERRAAMARGLQRVSHAAWVHDGPGVAAMLERLCGAALGEGRRLNTTNPTIEGEPDVLDARTLEIIDAFVSEDRELLDMAASAGLVEPLSAEDSDAIFRKTAMRLGYVFA